MALKTHFADVRDPNNQKAKYDLVKDKPIVGIQQSDSEIILQHLRDLEIGRNVNGSKGVRSYGRLNTVRSRLKGLSEIIFNETGKNLISVSEEELIRVAKKMRDGTILTNKGKAFRASGDYFQAYKAFWNWYKKIQKKEGKAVEDKTEYLDTTRDKPKFNYLTFDQVKTLADSSKYVYKVMI